MLPVCLLPIPRLTIVIDPSQFSRIIQALALSVIEGFQDLRSIGELRQRWEEIKKLRTVSTSPVKNIVSPA